MTLQKSKLVPSLFPGALLLLLVILSSCQISQPRHTFEIGKEQFMLDGKPYQIRCGELHFARIPKEYWRHRIQMMKSLGMNTVCAYLFWNFHERTPGEFKFASRAIRLRRMGNGWPAVVVTEKR